MIVLGTLLVNKSPKCLGMRHSEVRLSSHAEQTRLIKFALKQQISGALLGKGGLGESDSQEVAEMIRSQSRLSPGSD
ncbi:hypothetical protein Y1Q_0010280 [Alligator mississippiensis]|uniref:Uncharacterized protein n=1 Tax=Alligator mississippiensis TaxID=8496 RepID=A0A151P209_ALLMI|nr:hypothetical protein Y1Q_0010280 [Alligator mississippiensis]